MRRTTTVAVQAIVAAAVVAGFATVLGTGSAHAAPQD